MTTAVYVAIRHSEPSVDYSPSGDWGGDGQVGDISTPLHLGRASAAPGRPDDNEINPNPSRASIPAAEELQDQEVVEAPLPGDERTVQSGFRQDL